METNYDSFEDLWIWQEAMRLCYDVHEQVETLRDFSLKDQLQRSSVSVPSNIAEGFELGTIPGFIRLLYIAKGSGGELRTQLYVALKRKYIPELICKELIQRARKNNGMIANFIKEKRKQQRKKSVAPKSVNSD